MNNPPTGPGQGPQNEQQHQQQNTETFGDYILNSRPFSHIQNPTPGRINGNNGNAYLQLYQKVFELKGTAKPAELEKVKMIRQLYAMTKQAQAEKAAVEQAQLEIAELSHQLNTMTKQVQVASQESSITNDAHKVALLSTCQVLNSIIYRLGNGRILSVVFDAESLLERELKKHTQEFLLRSNGKEENGSNQSLVDLVPIYPNRLR
jgi:hypothetical protein